MRQLTILSLLVLSQTAVHADIDLSELDRCARACSSDCDNIILKVQNHLIPAQYNCGILPNPAALKPVYFYSASNCTSGFLTQIRPDADCDQLTKDFPNQNVASISIGGNCTYTNTRNLLVNCILFKAAAIPNAVALHTNDDCSTNTVIGYVSLTTNCDELKNTNYGTRSIEAVSVNNKCFDIADTDPASACVKYKNLD